MISKFIYFYLKLFSFLGTKNDKCSINVTIMGNGWNPRNGLNLMVEYKSTSMFNNTNCMDQQLNTKTNTDLNTNTNTDLNTNTKTNLNTNTDLNTSTELKTKTNTDRNTNTGLNTKTNTDRNTNTDLNTNTNTDLNIITYSNTNTQHNHRFEHQHRP